MISDIVESANEIVKNVTVLDYRAGLTSMHFTDPTMRNAPKPCAWVIYAGSNNTQVTSRPIPGVVDLSYEIIVKVLLAYNTEEDLLNVQYPVLDAIRSAMTTTKIDALKACEYFKFEQETLEEIDDRLVYVMRFSFSGN